MPRALALLLALAAAAACDRGMDPPEPQEPTIPPATFASVVTELAAARSQLLPDTAAYRTRRDEILARHRVTPDDLRRFARGYGRNEDLLLAVYRPVKTRIDSLFGTGMPEGAGPPTAAPDTAP